MRHLLAARAVLSGEARGIARGATRFFDPSQLDKLHHAYAQWVAGGRQGEKPMIVSCDALSLLEAWCFDLGRDPATTNSYPSSRNRQGNQTQAWVGPIAGIDPWRLMLMKPMAVGEEHRRRYQAAKPVILAAGRPQPWTERASKALSWHWPNIARSCRAMLAQVGRMLLYTFTMAELIEDRAAAAAQTASMQGH
jgi:hypothetical protein